MPGSAVTWTFAGSSMPGSRFSLRRVLLRCSAVCGRVAEQDDRLVARDEQRERRAPGPGADDRDARGAAVPRVRLAGAPVAPGDGRHFVRAARCAGAAVAGRGGCLGSPPGAFARRRRAAARTRRPLAEHEPDRRAEETERLAQPVLEVAPVAEVDRARLAGEEHERRRRDGHLRRVEQLRAPALDRRRLLARRGVAHDPVQLAGRDAPAALGPHVDGELQHARHALAGLRRDASRSARSRGTAPRSGSTRRTGRRSCRSSPRRRPTC